MVDAGGAVQSAASYEPFGAHVTNGASSYGFAGEWSDPTGLVYLRARFYSPELGIFLSRDPFPGFQTQPASLTPYQYAYNNPVLLTDPSGKNPLLLEGLLGSAISNYGYLNEGMCPWEALENIIALINLGIGEDDPITDFIVSLPFSDKFYSDLATALDIVAWAIDAFSAGVVTYGGIFGAGIGAPFIPAGGPEVPVVTGAAGAGIAELYVQPALNTANILATMSTASTLISDIKKGDTIISQAIISPTVSNSISLTALGWLNKEAYISLTFQTLAVTNDLSWTSLPYR
jgi:RHS repeat-associated protein